MERKDLLGARFFLGENRIKVTKYVNENTVSCLDMNTKEIHKMPLDTLLNDWNLLNPDGRVIFNIVTTKGAYSGSVQDVIVAFYSEKDIEGKSHLPYCVARQNVVNLYNEYIKKYDNFTHAGMCMAKDTIPTGIDYRMMLACDKSDKSIMVACYMDDTLDDILRCVKSSDFDRVLQELFMRNYAMLSEKIKREDQPLKEEIYYGFCKHLRSFMEYHDVMYDIRRGMGIGTIDIPCLPDDISETISILEKSYNKKMYDPVISEYSKEIVLSNITRNFVIFCTKDEKFYICAYDEEDVGLTSSMSVEEKLNNLDKLVNNN